MLQMKVKYLGASDTQILFGKAVDDPRDVLIEGEIYEVERRDIYAWHTVIRLKGIEGNFNSVYFEEMQ